MEAATLDLRDPDVPDSASAGRARVGVRGMTSSFESVYRRHRDELVRALSLALNDEGLAAESVDEAFTRALHRWHLVGTFPNPQAWVYRTARNHAMSRFRRRSRDRRYAHKVGTATLVDDRLPDPALAAALRQLRDDQRNVLVLRYYLDWSVEAVADVLDVSPGTVKSRTSRALNELNRLLGGSR